jgi:hypothetical protein
LSLSLLTEGILYPPFRKISNIPLELIGGAPGGFAKLRVGLAGCVYSLRAVFPCAAGAVRVFSLFTEKME